MGVYTESRIRTLMSRVPGFSIDRIGPASVDLPIAEVYHISRKKNPDRLQATKVWESGGDPLPYLSDNGYYLAVTKHVYEFPPDAAGFITVRSTYARLGVFTPITFIDPGFRGQIVIEFHSSVYLDRSIYPIEPDDMFQLVYMRAEPPAQRVYRGRYQDQRGLRMPDGTRYIVGDVKKRGKKRGGDDGAVDEK